MLRKSRTGQIHLISHKYVTIHKFRSRISPALSFSNAGKQADRRALDAQSDFDAVSRLVKLEFSRFEQERIEDLKSTMEAYITEAVDAQQKVS